MARAFAGRGTNKQKHANGKYKRHLPGRVGSGGAGSEDDGTPPRRATIASR
jgi:hypothetical protein